MPMNYKINGILLKQENHSFNKEILMQVLDIWTLSINNLMIWEIINSIFIIIVLENGL